MVVIIAYEPVNKAIFGVFNLGSTSTLYRQYTMYEDPQIMGNSSSNCISYSKVMWNIQDPMPVIKRLMYKNANLEYVKKGKFRRLRKKVTCQKRGLQMGKFHVHLDSKFCW